MSNKPFIIPSRILQSMVPKQSQIYDEKQQTKIQILQAINGYLAINMFIEGCKLVWSFLHFQTECPAYSYLSLGFMGIDFIWAICSYYGFKSVNSKNARNIRIFGYTVIGNFFLRIIMYIICGIVMSGYAPNYAVMTTEQLNKMICTALYPEILYVVTGAFEAIISLVVLYLLKSVVSYVERWQRSEVEKHLPMKDMYNNY